MNELSLFSGAGGGLLGSSLLGWTPVCYVERDAYCQKVLRARIRDGMLHNAPIHDDVRTFDGNEWTGRVDVVTAGFPCQPFSVAGRRRADADERNGWPDTARILRQVRPRFALLENVPGLAAHPYFGTVLGDLAESGFDAEWDCYSAAAVGAHHIRDRLWILAYSGCEREHRIQPVCELGRGEEAGVGGGGEMADADKPRLEGRELLSERADERPSRQSDVGDAECVRELQPQRRESDERRRLSDAGWWSVEPELGRVAHGVADRMDRLRALGNGQVPPVVVRAWRELSERIHA